MNRPLPKLSNFQSLPGFRWTSPEVVTLSPAKLENEARYWERQAQFHDGYDNALDKRWHAEALDKARKYRDQLRRVHPKNGEM